MGRLPGVVLAFASGCGARSAVPSGGDPGGGASDGGAGDPGGDPGGESDPRDPACESGLGAVCGDDTAECVPGFECFGCEKKGPDTGLCGPPRGGFEEPGSEDDGGPIGRGFCSWEKYACPAGYYCPALACDLGKFFAPCLARDEMAVLCACAPTGLVAACAGLADEPTRDECVAMLGGDDPCAPCGCEKCPREVGECLADPACAAIVRCVMDTGCRGIDCLPEDTCMQAIDDNGGIDSEAVWLAGDFLMCLDEICGCP